MDTVKVEHNGVAVTVSRANVKRGFARTRERALAQSCELEGDLLILRLFTYPDIIGGTSEVVGMDWPITFEQFLELDDELVSRWERAVYACNPHWLPQAEDPKA